MPGFRRSSTAVEGPPVASEGGTALNQPESLPKPRLSMTGLKEILLPRPPDALSPSASKRLAGALFGSHPEGDALEKRKNVLELLERVTIFEGLGRSDLQRVARIVHEREYNDGEHISHEGKPGAALFILRRGLVDVTRRGPDGADVTLATLEPPATFDEEAATGADTIRRFSTRARGPVSLLALGRRDLDALCEAFPPLANRVLMRLACVMSNRLQKLLDAFYVTEYLEGKEHEEPKA